MRIGIHTAQIGRLASGAAVRSAARSAEELGYSSLWVLDRLPVPVTPRNSYAGNASLDLPIEQRRSLDPLMVLAVSGAVTTHLRLGVSALVAPWYRPALLARTLTSLDALTDGRITVGLGLGWSTDEYEAVGVTRQELGDKLDEVLDVLDAHWSDGPISFSGPNGRIALAYNDLRTVQRPRPPVVLAASSRRGFDRISRRADGWTTSNGNAVEVGTQWDTIRADAERYGRDPEKLELYVRANIHLTPGPLSGERPPYVGSVGQVADDLAAIRCAGADEVILGLTGDPGLDQALDTYAQVAEAVELRTGGMVRR